MRTTTYIVLFLAVACLAGSAEAFSEVHIDFQAAGATTALGYLPVTNVNRWDNSTTTNLGGGIQAGWLDAFNGSTFDRTTYTDVLLRDGLAWSSSSPAETLKIAGLAPGTYNLKIYGTDPQYPDKQTSYNIDQDNDGVTDIPLTIKNNLTEHNKTVSVTISAAGILSIVIDGIGGATGAINALDLTPGVVDATSPAAITTLSPTGQTTTTITVHWTAPADDNGTGGRVASYDVRYSTGTIDDTNWATASQATGGPSPAAPGTQETFTISGLTAGTTYFVAVKSADYAAPANVSPLSNVISVATQAPDVTPPAAVIDLAVSTTTASQATLTWTSPTDDSGKAASYDLRYSMSPIDATNWASASQATGEPVPANPGTQETFTVSGLTDSTTYYFALKSADAGVNIAPLSNVPSAVTQAPDTTCPAVVTDLRVGNTASTSVLLLWTAPADDNGTGGRVASYDVRYATSPITVANWAAASQAVGEPVPGNPETQEALTVAGLAASTTYYFAIRSSDASNNVTPLSNIVVATTLAQALRSEVHADFQIAGCVTAPGYVAVLNTNRWDTGSYVDLGGGVQGAWKAAYVGDSRDRSTADPLTRDFLTFRYANAPQVFQMRGIQPGTYSLKIYATDVSFHDKQSGFAIDQNNDGSADVSMTIRETAGEANKAVTVTVSMAGILSISCSALTSSVDGVINGLDLTAAVDTFAPAGVSDLAVTAMNSTQATLHWTAPADDNGAAGRVSSYDVRYATSPIDAASWASASQGTGEPVPANPGQVETFQLSGLLPGTTYYFAVKSADLDNNISPLSNVPTGITEPADAVPPAAVSNLAATAVDANQLTLTWTATGDDATTGMATAYSLRYSTSPITDDATFAAATLLVGLAAPKPAGAAEWFTVTGLVGGTTYWFAIKVSDEMPSWSALSNVLPVTTLPPDVTAPATITDLAIVDMQSSAVTLRWTAPGDDSNVGTAVAYDVRYSTAPITDDATFAAAQAFATVPAPLPAGTAQIFIGGGLSPDTTYYFAIKAHDNGVPPNVSALSSVVSDKTLAAGTVAYAVSNEFSLDAAPTGPYAPAVPVAGAISISNINVDRSAIVRTVKRAGPVYSGLLHYDVAAPTTNVHVWLELSTDGGTTWSERRIHAVGAVGTISAGSSKSVQWLVDGDHGHHCRIRIRVNDAPATYSDLDADHNKYPRPAPWAEYPNLERLADSKDFLFTDSRYSLPHVDFYKAVASGQIRAGFSRTVFFGSTAFFLHCIYLESADGRQKWVILQGDVQKVWTDTIHRWRDQIQAAFGIPEEHVMVFFTHVHNGADRWAGIDTFPTSLLASAIANAQPVEIGWFNQDMGTTYNTHRNLFTSATAATSSYSNGIYDGGVNPLSILWQYDTQGNAIAALLDGAAIGSSYQRYFDCPLDSYLQMLVFRNADTHDMKGVLVKFTMHPVAYDYYGDQPRAIMDTMQAKFGTGVEVLFTSGFGANHRPLTSEKYPAAEGSLRVANAFTNALDAALPAMEFKPLLKLGMVMGFDQFGAYMSDSTKNGIDPDRLGTAVQVFRFNDLYLSTLPGEAPSEQGLYIRARTQDLKHVYNAYGNTWYNYYTWGRWFDIQHYEGAYNPDRYESFRMAQEIVRGVNILEQSVDALQLPGDINNDSHCDVLDLLRLAGVWGLSQGNPGFDATCDLNSDGRIDVVDLLTLADSFGKY